MIKALNRTSICALLYINTSIAIGFYSNLHTGKLRKTFSSYRDKNDNAIVSDTIKLSFIQSDKNLFEKSLCSPIDTKLFIRLTTTDKLLIRL
jgi:hypothetical protein